MTYYTTSKSKVCYRKRWRLLLSVYSLTCFMSSLVLRGDTTRQCDVFCLIACDCTACTCLFDRADATADVQRHCRTQTVSLIHFFPAQGTLGANGLDQLAKPTFRSRYANTSVMEQSEGPTDTVASTNGSENFVGPRPVRRLSKRGVRI